MTNLGKKGDIWCLLSLLSFVIEEVSDDDAFFLEILNLSENDLTGVVSSEMTSLVNLRILKLQSNKLSGKFSDAFGGLVALGELFPNSRLRE